MALFTMQAHAQTSETRTKNGYISVSTGTAFPVGDFANNNTSNDKAGLATEGAQVNLMDFGYLFSKNFGISVLLGGGIYSFDKDVRDANFSLFPAWTHFEFMAGPLLSFPLANGDVEFDVRALAGFLNATLPTGTFIGFPEDSKFVASYGNGWGSAFDIGFGFRFHYNERASLTIRLDYISSKPDLGNGYEQKITAFNLTLGVAFRLN